MTKYLREGDRVRFKTWAALKRRYGIDYYGIVNCAKSFMQAMKHLCGTHATISGICDDGTIYLTDFEADGRTDWNYSTDMVVRVRSKDAK